MKKLSTLFLLFTVLVSCKDPDSVVEPEVSPGIVLVGVTTTFTSFTPTSAKAGQTLTLTGSNFSTTLNENLVIFTTQNSAVSVTPKTATATTITVDVPAIAVTGMIAVKVKGITAQMATGFNGVLTIVP